MKIQVPLEEETLSRLNPFGGSEEDADTKINRILDYMGFHTKEFLDSEP